MDRVKNILSVVFYHTLPLTLCSNNLEVFIEEARFLIHPQFFRLVVPPNKGELLGEGRPQLVVRGAHIPHLHLGRVERQKCKKTDWQNSKKNELYSENVAFARHMNGGEEK